MTSRHRVVQRAQLLLRLQRLTHEIEELVPELKTVLTDGSDSRQFEPAALSLQRAASAAKAVVESANPRRLPEEIRAVLEGTSPLLSFLGSRLVLKRKGRSLSARPSIAAQALAVLLEDPAREFDAAEVAKRLDCSVPIARTTLNRLVRSGHASRPSAGRFRAR